MLEQATTVYMTVVGKLREAERQFSGGLLKSQANVDILKNVSTTAITSFQ
jgi:hypothetical protein